MKRLSRPSGAQLLIGLLFLLAAVFGMMMQRAGQVEPLAPRARFDDASPLGGKGLRLLLSRSGFAVQRVNTPLQAMPQAARVWVLLDPQTRFSRRELKLLLDWIRRGGTLIWASAPSEDVRLIERESGTCASTLLAQTLEVEPSSSFSPPFLPLPELAPLTPSVPAPYWTGVKSATSSGDTFRVRRAALELAGNFAGSQLVRLQVGKGRVFIAPDALLFTNYALSKPDNATLVSNLVRVHATSGGVYFDERNRGDSKIDAVVARILTWWDYLWQAPLRYALLQVLFAGVLWWAFAGRRLGAPVPLPVLQPVTRASEFALGMGALFRKANRPQAAARVLGDNFRREVARRTGLPIDADDSLLAERAAQRTGLSPQMIDRLLLRAKAPDDRESHILNDTQEMEIVLRALRGERN